jgi:hypothetical protein
MGCSTSSTSSIGDNGGTIALGDGTSIDVPSGALSENQQISVTEDDSAPALSSAQAVGKNYLFGPEGLQFAKPVSITLAFDPSQVLGSNTVVVFTAAKGSSDYTALETTQVDGSHVTAQTSHFSNFVAGIWGNGNPVDASVADLVSPSDLSSKDGPICTVICNSMATTFDGGSSSGTRCTCTSNCAGSIYMINCGQYFDASLGSCECTTNGNITATTTATCFGTSPTYFMKYQSVCGYPGSLPPL